MTSTDPIRATARPISRFAFAAMLALITVVGACQPVSSASRAFSSRLASSPMARPPMTGRPSAHHAALGEADGAIPEGTTLFDDDVPGVANLDPTLRDALRQAARVAANDGVEFLVNSGWRSSAYQAQLLREAVSKYGSKAKAARWVGTPKTSAHVSGDAVDLGPVAAIAWLAQHGADYGLCQIYRNEPWHYERRPDAAHHGCPPMYADAAHDPRMQP